MARKRESRMVVLGGYELSNGVPVRKHINVAAGGDHGADPLGDGTFRMIPSGDVVSLEERNRRLPRPK